MLDGQAKYTQAPYQSMNVMDPAGRRSLLASRGPVNVPRHIRRRTPSVCAWGEMEQVFMGEQQEELLHNNNSI